MDYPDYDDETVFNTKRGRLADIRDGVMAKTGMSHDAFKKWVAKTPTGKLIPAGTGRFIKFTRMGGRAGISVTSYTVDKDTTVSGRASRADDFLS